MTRLIIATILTAASIATVSAPASAGKINHRENHQQNRVTSGVATGKLSEGEFDRIEKREQAIRKEQRFLKDDGTLSNFDKRVLKQQLDRSSRLINRLKHN